MKSRARQGRQELRRPWRCVTSLAMLVTLIAAMPPALGFADKGRLIGLTETVRLSARTTGYATVFLPRAVQGNEDFPRLVERWAGAASAVVLAPDRADVFDPTNPPPALVVPNLPGRTANPHPYVFIGLDQRHHEPNAFYHRLPPGRYRLYVITSGPARVTLHLPGLPSGETNVTTRTPGHARTVGMRKQAAIGSLSPIFSYGATGGLTRDKGLVLTVQWMRVPARAAEAFGACHYSPPPPSSLAYQVPNCAAARTIGGPNIAKEYIGYVPPPDLLGESEWYGVPPGPSGMQTYMVVAGPVQSEGAEILWLSW